MPKVVQLRSCGEKHRKTAQKADIFQMSIYLCFFEDAGIYIYIYIPSKWQRITQDYSCISYPIVAS